MVGGVLGLEYRIKLRTNYGGWYSTKHGFIGV